MKLHPAAWSLLLMLGVGVVVAAVYALQPREEGTPDLTLTTTDNDRFRLADNDGRVVVLDFFNIYCESCIILEKELMELQPKWSADDVTFVSIGGCCPNDLGALRTYQESHGINWTVATDDDGGVEKYSVVAFPTLVIVDGQGEVVFHRSGLADADELEPIITQAVALERAPVDFARYSLWGLAVVAAVASFFSPCAVGLLPGYVAHTVRFPSDAEGGRLARAAQLGVLAALGLLVVFLGIGAIAYAAGEAIGPYIPWIGPLVGVLFVLVGLLLLVRPYSTLLQRFFSPLTTLDDPQPTQRSRWSYFLYGMGYGAGSAGCTAPVLLSLVGLAISAGPTAGLGIIVLWAVTAAVLMAVLTVVVAGGREGVAAWIRRNAKKVETLSALFFVGAGLFLVWFAWRAGALL